VNAMHAMQVRVMKVFAKAGAALPPSLAHDIPPDAMACATEPFGLYSSPQARNERVMHDLTEAIRTMRIARAGAAGQAGPVGGVDASEPHLAPEHEAATRDAVAGIRGQATKFLKGDISARTYADHFAGALLGHTPRTQSELFAQLVSLLPDEDARLDLCAAWLARARDAALLNTFTASATAATVAAAGKAGAHVMESFESKVSEDVLGRGPAAVSQLRDTSRTLRAVISIADALAQVGGGEGRVS